MCITQTPAPDFTATSTICGFRNPETSLMISAPASKAALVSLTRQLGHELGAWDITVNCIAPGFVRSNPATERQWASYGAEGQRALVDGIALKRLGTPADIAYGVLFFASEQANWITGQVIAIDGGK